MVGELEAALVDADSLGEPLVDADSVARDEAETRSLAEAVMVAWEEAEGWPLTLGNAVAVPDAVMVAPATELVSGAR